jgi:hypothetical protein
MTSKSQKKTAALLIMIQKLIASSSRFRNQTSSESISVDLGYEQSLLAVHII